MGAERKSHVQKLQVAVAPAAGVVQGFPYGQYARVLQSIGLAHAAREPQVGIAARVDAGAAAYDSAFVGDDEDAASPLWGCGLQGQLFEEFPAGEVAAYLPGIDVVEHVGKCLDLVDGLGFPHFGTVFQSFPDLPDA